MCPASKGGVYPFVGYPSYVRALFLTIGVRKFFAALALSQLQSTRIRQLAPPRLSPSICCMPTTRETLDKFS